MKSIEEIFANLIAQEAFFQERIDYAKEKAKKIINNQLETEQDVIERMKYLISSHFKLPYHSPYFDDLTFDELVLEMMLINEGQKDVETRSGEIIKENREEAEDAFGGLIDKEELDVPEEFSEEEKEFIANQGKAFMQGGFNSIAK